MNIQRRVAFVKGLQDELDLRLHRIDDLVSDVSTVDGSASFDDKFLSANTAKTNFDAKIDKAQIVDDVTSGGSDNVLSAEQGKQLKILIDGMSTGLIFKGSFDIGTETSLPGTPETGDFYKIVNTTDPSVSETIDGFHLTQGDSIYRGDSAWIKLDSTESADLLREADISLDVDFTVEPTKLADRGTIKSLVDNATSSIDTKFINESVTITGDSGTLSHEPKDDVVFTGTANVDNGDGTFDLVECSASGTTLTLAPNVAGTYDGKVATATYAYI